MAGAAAAVAVFVIRPRARSQALPSLIIWNRVLGEARKKSFWERVRWAVSLAFTAMIAAAMAAALAKPAPRTDSQSSGRALLVLDSSWSMRARTSSGATRWERAIEDARAMAGASSAAEIAIATTAEGVVEGPTADLALIHSALSRLEPSGGADGAWPALAGAGSVHFFTDGAVARATKPDVTVHSVFAPASNVAVTAFGVEPETTGGSGAEVFLAVANFAPNAQTVHLTVTRGSGMLFDRSLPVRAGESHREVIPVPTEGDARFHAHVTAPDNALDIDDDAVAWLWAAQPLRVVVVGAASLVPALLVKDATVRVSTVDPAAYAKADADVWIFDRWLPPAAPARPALIIDPPSSPWLGARGEAEAQPIWRRGTTHPIVDGVDTAIVRVGRARAVTRPSLQTLVVSQGGTPLVSIEDNAAGRYVVLGFSTQDANFASTPAFPILVGNVIDWLGRPERGVHRQPGPVSPAGGHTARRRADRASAAARQTRRSRHHDPAGAGPVSGRGHGRSKRGQRRTRRSGPLESAGEHGGCGWVAGQASRAEGRPWWVYAAWVALVLVGLEWVTWQRRITV